MKNLAEHEARLTIRDGYSGRRVALTLRTGQSTARSWNVSPTRGWYNLVLTSGPLRQHLAGHLETGEDSITDPAMGGLC